MRIGHVTPDRRAWVRISVKGPSGTAQEINALLDTGFNETLALSSERIAALGLKRRSATTVVLASGERRHVPTYRATVRFGADGQSVLIAEAGAPLVGMALLWERDLHVRCVEDGHVALALSVSETLQQLGS